MNRQTELVGNTHEASMKAHALSLPQPLLCIPNPSLNTPTSKHEAHINRLVKCVHAQDYHMH